MLSYLLNQFNSQINEFNAPCEILLEIDNGELTKGEKRNRLLDRATGDYCAFFDDDDDPSNNYIKLILDAIESNPDCCSLVGEITTNGLNPEIFEHSIVYTKWETVPNDKIKYRRMPNHLNAIKTSIAKQIKFPEINHGEDLEWSKTLMESGLLKTEVKIPETIYYYKYVTLK